MDRFEELKALPAEPCISRRLSTTLAALGLVGIFPIFRRWPALKRGRELADMYNELLRQDTFRLKKAILKLMISRILARHRIIETARP